MQAAYGALDGPGAATCVGHEYDSVGYARAELAGPEFAHRRKFDHHALEVGGEHRMYPAHLFFGGRLAETSGGHHEEVGDLRGVDGVEAVVWRRGQHFRKSWGVGAEMEDAVRDAMDRVGFDHQDARGGLACGEDGEFRGHARGVGSAFHGAHARGEAAALPGRVVGSKSTDEIHNFRFQVHHGTS